MKYGFIGAGNMAVAIVRGMLSGQVAKPGDILIFDTNDDRQAAVCGELGVTGAGSAAWVVSASDVVFLAVKPHVLGCALEGIREEAVRLKPLFISMAAGRSLDYITGILGEGVPVARVMPNVNAAVGESVTAICCCACVSESQRQTALLCVGAIGTAVELREEDFPLFTALCGSSPAITFLFIETLAKAAHRRGMDKKLAVRLAAQAVLGSARMLMESYEHPRELADMVCSPGGMTIEGVCDLAATGFEASILSAMNAMIDMDKRL